MYTDANNTLLSKAPQSSTTRQEAAPQANKNQQQVADVVELRPASDEQPVRELPPAEMAKLIDDCRFMIIPEAGQGARNEKSCTLVGGATEMNPVISGRRIINCIATHAPKENPPIQHVDAFGLWVCIQSSAVAASDNSPWPLSNLP